MTRHRWLAAVVLVGLVLAGCGQKEGVHVASGGGSAGQSNAFDNLGGANGGTTETTAAGGTTETSAAAAAAGGTGGATATTAPAGGPASKGSTATTAARTGAAAGGSTGGSSGAAGGTATTAAGGPQDRTGVTDTEIRIGLHGPATGAGAPAPSFDMGKNVYWNVIGSGINGRKVSVFFEDDGYNPSQAVAACKKLVEQDHVFLLAGAGGTDQIVACSQYAASVGVPYLAEGVTEKGLANLSNYFALTF